MRSAIYTGTVDHRRLEPKQHQFSYKIYMLYLDLDELDQVLAISPYLSSSRWAPMQFKRRDFHGDESDSIKNAVYKTVEREIGYQLSGPIALLSHWRCFGFNFNPISTYYCYDESGENLEVVVAEVTNTPWLERHAYVMDVREQAYCRKILDKKFTVSPFNPLDMQYRWRSDLPGESLFINIENFISEKRVFHATLKLSRVALSRRNVRRALIRFPMITLKVVFSIYWQALKLFLKGVPFLGKDRLAAQR